MCSPWQLFDKASLNLTRLRVTMRLNLFFFLPLLICSIIFFSIVPPSPSKLVCLFVPPYLSSFVPVCLHCSLVPFLLFNHVTVLTHPDAVAICVFWTPQNNSEWSPGQSGVRPGWGAISIWRRSGGELSYIQTNTIMLSLLLLRNCIRGSQTGIRGPPGVSDRTSGGPQENQD